MKSHTSDSRLFSLQSAGIRSCVLLVLVGLHIYTAVFALRADASTIEWGRQFGTAGTDIGRGIAADSSGSVYVTGVVQGNLAAPLDGFSDVVLRKYDSSGGTLWTRQIGSGGEEEGYGVAVDGLGNVYVSGPTTGDLGGPNAGEHDVFVRKYDPSGNVLWTQQLGTAAVDVAFAISADAMGNAYVTGYTNGSLAIPNSGTSDLFVAK